MDEEIQKIIEELALIPHPVEGGFFRETYRSDGFIPEAALPGVYPGRRNCSTAIYYLLTAETFSEMHRLPGDEVFHFYRGDPVEMLQLHSGGAAERITLGGDILAGEKVQLVVPGGVWQGCRLQPGGRFALLGCTVAPGFDYADYTRGDRDELIRDFPDEEDMIRQLTKESESHD